ncbi:uncharacterized protein LOC129576735 isoform X3 [Sitodiplosis mosellana]|uniref:uncharacterized protein LOC129576735 isoform X3 n=1 Tax=Sitodiplosis mosellana TaxID=263140 RepID=UPI002444A93D|nr:uncharacterized protein LOC129576735 isoform X3 [Sitodiplosis mosellana]
MAKKYVPIDQEPKPRQTNELTKTFVIAAAAVLAIIIIAVVIFICGSGRDAFLFAVAAIMIVVIIAFSVSSPFSNNINIGNYSFAFGSTNIQATDEETLKRLVEWSEKYN